MNLNSKILVTGGSGFIGTNIVQYYLTRGFEVINLDIKKPRNIEHEIFWVKLNILDYHKLEYWIKNYQPDYLIHLAAITDLNVTGKSDQYLANYDGVKNVINVLKKCGSIKRAVFASTMLVCKVGYLPKHINDYCPTTLYGQSKVKAENLIKKEKKLSFEPVIIRPTSLWGPWFGEPYLQYFLAIKNKKFVKFGRNLGTKTFGYVDNAVHQINAILSYKGSIKISEIFYIGDRPGINIGEWADLISEIIGTSPAPTIPQELAIVLSKMGDFIQFLGFNSPITSFRLRNMLTDNLINLDNIYDIAGDSPYSIHDGILNTIEWIEEYC